MSTQYQTTMKDLMTRAKKVLVDESNGGNDILSTVKTFKRGVLPPIPWFPAVALIPINETIPRVYSGGEYVVRRELSVDVWDKRYKFAEAEQNCMSILTAVRDVLEDNFRLVDKEGNDAAVDIEFGAQEIGEAEPYQTGVVQSTTMRVAFVSHETVPSERKLVTVLKEKAPKELLEYVAGVVRGYGGSLLSAVRRFYDTAVPPAPLFPAIGVVAPDVSAAHYETGRDEAMRRITIWIWTKLLDKEVNLDLNLDVMEKIKDIVQIEYKWGGYAKDTQIQNIAFGQMPLGTYSVYATAVDINIDCVRVL